MIHYIFECPTKIRYILIFHSVAFPANLMIAHSERCRFVTTQFESATREKRKKEWKIDNICIFPGQQLHLPEWTIKRTRDSPNENNIDVHWHTFITDKETTSNVSLDVISCACSSCDASHFNLIGYLFAENFSFRPRIVCMVHLDGVPRYC